MRDDLTKLAPSACLPLVGFADNYGNSTRFYTEYDALKFKFCFWSS